MESSIFSICSIGRLEKSFLGPEPLTLRHEIPVGAREDLLLEVVEGARGLRLVFEEGCVGLTAVLELTKDKFAIAYENWAGCIPVVSRLFVDLTKLFKHILHEDGCLAEDGGSCLRGWKIRDITMAEDVGVAVVLESRDVNIEPAVGVSQVGFTNEGRGSLWWHDMHEVKVLRHGLIAIKNLKGSRAVVLID